MRMTTGRNVCKALGLMLFMSVAAFADNYTVGFLSYDLTGTDTAAFDIANLTGSNALPPDFPILTTVNLSSLSLTVHFSDGSTVTEPSSYFSLALDGQSFNGSDIGVGGTNPLPTEATLTGSFSPTTINVDGVGTVDINPTFSLTLLPSSGPDLADGDLAIIFATTAGTSTVPEANSWFLLGTVMLLMAFTRRTRLRNAIRKLSSVRHGAAAVAVLALACLMVAAPVYAATITQAAATVPSTGVAGANNVNVTASQWPAADTTPGNITVMWETTCGGAASATNSANSITTVIGSTKRVNVSIPGTLSTGTYFVQLSDSAAGDTPITSSTCSAVQVTGSSKTLAACVPASSLGVVAPITGPAPVFAIAPNASWSTPFTMGAQVVQIETGGGGPAAPVSLALPDFINSCAGNPATGEAVCVANSNKVFHIKGVGTTNSFTSLTSGSNTTAGFSGGSCRNCGVAVNSAGNYAVINEGFSPSPSNSALQSLDLSTDTFKAPFPMAREVSENIAIDPIRGVVLSANENSFYELAAINSSGLISAEYSLSIGIGELDSSAEDCATGIAIAPAEFTNSFTMVDLTQATFVPGTPGTWTAPKATATIIGSYAAGLSGAAVAPGGQHLGVVTGEFGGSSFAVIKLPSTSGSGTPALADYAYVCGVSGFSAGFDPHTLTAYVSPNTGLSYALFANWPNDFGPTSLLQADLAGILALPRLADGHTIVGDSSCVLNPAGSVGSKVLKSFATH